MAVRCPRLGRFVRLSLPYLLFVGATTGVVTLQNHQNAESREVLCKYANRLAAGARLDRQFLVALTTRPGLPPDKTRDAIIKVYLEFGDKAYPKLNCADVRAGRLPPGLPVLPPSPLATTTTTTP